jgi:hypothetical protein
MSIISLATATTAFEGSFDFSLKCRRNKANCFLKSTVHLLNMLSESTQIFMIPIFLSGKIQREIRGLLMHFMNMGNRIMIVWRMTCKLIMKTWKTVQSESE